MDFKCSVRVQTAIEGIIYFTILIGVGLLLFAIWDFGDSEYNSFQLERTQAGSIQGKYIDSSGSAKSYYVTVRNGRYEADHEVSHCRLQRRQGRSRFPDRADRFRFRQTDEAQEQADNAQADLPNPRRLNARTMPTGSVWTHQLLTNMSAAGE